MNRTLTVATYNIHKGLSLLGRRSIIHGLRERLRALDADVVFLQEVQGDQRHRGRRHENGPAQPQYEFLADSVWRDFAYGRNAVYDHGHHGNAVLSRYPIERWDNEDISAHATESRGLLHCEVRVPGWDERLHCVCVHLGLFARWRRQQLAALRDRIERMVPARSPLVVAGDFNDWRGHAEDELAGPLGLAEVFHAVAGRTARSYPAALPVLRLDRIYVRGFEVESARVHHGRRMSDHAALASTLRRA